MIDRRGFIGAVAGMAIGRHIRLPETESQAWLPVLNPVRSEAHYIARVSDGLVWYPAVIMHEYCMVHQRELFVFQPQSDLPDGADILGLCVSGKKGWKTLWKPGEKYRSSKIAPVVTYVDAEGFMI